MRSMRAALLIATHVVVLGIGFAAGIYALPLLTAPASPAPDALALHDEAAPFHGQFTRDLRDSDVLHYGEGRIAVSAHRITLQGELAPGPDYKLYLSPRFVETEDAFEHLKASMVRVGDVRTFDGFDLPVPPGVDVERYNTVVIWCESFRQFISAAQYRE